MSKLSKLREAMRDPPQERLCLINARGYQIGILAIIVISLVLFQTVIWYISFIFIVQIVNNWVGYKREMKSYNSIIESRKMMGVYQEIDDDPSFTRRRIRLISEFMGEWVKYVLLFLIAMPLGYWFDLMNQGIFMRFIFVFMLMILFIVLYLYPTYWIADIIRGRRK